MPYHLSVYKKCSLCGEDLFSFKAKICDKCKQIMRVKKSEADYEGWIIKGGMPKEM
jgi:hypothetical protein